MVSHGRDRPGPIPAAAQKAEAQALVSRRFYSEHPPRAEYELTAKGKELGVIVGALASWGAGDVYARALGRPVLHAARCARVTGGGG